MCGLRVQLILMSEVNVVELMGREKKTKQAEFKGVGGARKTRRHRRCQLVGKRIELSMSLAFGLVAKELHVIEIVLFPSPKL